MNQDKVRDLVIIGASGFGREVANLVNDINKKQTTWNLLGLVDDNLAGETVEGFTILGTVNDLMELDPKPWLVVAIANTSIRYSLVEKLDDKGYEFATLIHPTVRIGKKIKFGEGAIVCANTLFTTNIDIGKHCILNINCSFGHDTQVGDFVSTMSHTAIAGDVVIGEGCYFGLNCTVINQVSIGPWGTYGAGAVVVSDMPSQIVAVGIPAKVIKTKNK